MPNSLPDSVTPVAEVIGVDAAMKLVRNWPRTNATSTTKGRVVIYVPITLAAEHPLIGIIGEVNAQKLVERFRGELLFLASCASIVAKQRDRAILDAIEMGATTETAARVLGVSLRHAYRIKRADKAAKDAVVR
jgi:hypothetical protein